MADICQLLTCGGKHNFTLCVCFQDVFHRVQSHGEARPDLQDSVQRAEEQASADCQSVHPAQRRRAQCRQPASQGGDPGDSHTEGKF